MPSPEDTTADANMDIDIDDNPSVVVRQSESELRLLESGEFSDFTIICGDREWKVHKAILSKVPYFNATVGGGLKETLEEKTTIKELFEPFEIQWLLAYIYFPYFDPESARFDTASKSYLETCVRLWKLGDYFQVGSMKNLAEEKLCARCGIWRRVSGTVDTAIHGTTFIVDVESAVRQAWRDDLVSGFLQITLTGLCLNFAPYLRDKQSFFTLLQEVPQFAVTFSQRAMGSITSSLRLPTPDGAIDPEGFRPQSARDEILRIRSWVGASGGGRNNSCTPPMKSCGGVAPRKRRRDRGDLLTRLEDN